MYYIGIVESDDAGFGVRIPDLPGCYAQAMSAEDAIADATLAAREWAEDHRGGGFVLPIPRSAGDIRADASAAFEAGSETMVLIPLLLDNQRTVKANISLDAGLLEQIDVEARRRGLTRSAFLSSAAIDKIAAGR